MTQTPSGQSVISLYTFRTDYYSAATDVPESFPFNKNSSDKDGIFRLAGALKSGGVNHKHAKLLQKRQETQ